jgi:spore germination cell wall hydrolase CwlJ-like protein
MRNKLEWVFYVGVMVLLFRVNVQTDSISDRVANLENIIIKTNHSVNYTQKDVECLTRNIYYEAGFESDVGKYAVGHVTMNRLRTGYWGQSVCKVIYSPSQFSWTLLKKLPKPDPVTYEHCRLIAEAVLSGYGVQGLDRSLFYHAEYIRMPNWADINHRVTQIGQHIFYNRAKGSKLEI